jgi:hypothetical protein
LVLRGGFGVEAREFGDESVRSVDWYLRISPSVAVQNGFSSRRQTVDTITNTLMKRKTRLLPVTLLRTTAQGAGFESSLEMTNTAKRQSVTVGIFDNADELEQAVAQLASAGFDGTAVYDEAIVAQEPGKVAPFGPVPVGPVLAPGVVPAEVAGSVERDVRDVPNIVSAFKSHLSDYDLPDQVIEAYTTTFYHGGKFVLVRTHPQRDEQVVKILRQCGASRVNRHD